MNSFRSIRLLLAFALFSCCAIALPLLEPDAANPTIRTNMLAVYPSPDVLLPEESHVPVTMTEDEDENESEAAEVSAEPSVEPLLPLLPADWPIMPTHLPLFDPKSHDPIEKMCRIRDGQRCCEHRFPCECTSEYVTPCKESHACEDAGMCHCVKQVCRSLSDR